MFIFQIDPANISGTENKMGISQPGNSPESVLLENLKRSHPIRKGDINGDGKVDQKDIRELISDLTAGDMNHDGKLDQQDYEILKKRIIPVPVPLEEGKQAVRPIRFGDLNHDGKIDQTDLNLLGKVLKSGDMDSDGKVDRKDLELLKEKVNPPLPHFPQFVSIDLDGDGKADYTIGSQGGPAQLGIFDVKNNTRVDSIPGVDLQKLADEIKQKLDGHRQIEFRDDINGDGTLDNIYANDLQVL